MAREVNERVHALSVAAPWQQVVTVPASSSVSAWVQRGIKEALAAARFTDWNPPHFWAWAR